MPPISTQDIRRRYGAENPGPANTVGPTHDPVPQRTAHPSPRREATGHVPGVAAGGGIPGTQPQGNTGIVHKRSRIANSEVPEDSPALVPYDVDIVNWVPMPRQNRRYAKWTTPNDFEVGRVLNLNLEEGEAQYLTKEPCGYLDIWNHDEQEVVRIVLDAPQKVSAAAAANLNIGDLILFQFTGYQMSRDSQNQWKDYLVHVADEGTNAAPF